MKIAMRLTMRLTMCLVLWLAIAFSITAGADSVSAEQSGTPWKIVNYWSISCAPCRIEIPELNQLSKELASSNVLVLGVNFDEDPPEKTRQLVKRMGIEFPTLSKDDIEALQLSAPNVLPTTYILSPDNKVRAKLLGAQDRASLKLKLAELDFSE